MDKIQHVFNSSKGIINPLKQYENSMSRAHYLSEPLSLINSSHNHLKSPDLPISNNTSQANISKQLNENDLLPSKLIHNKENIN